MVFVLLTLAGTASADPLSSRHIIRAAVDLESREIAGTVEIRMRNSVGKELREIRLALYPNHYLKPSPFINDVNYEWVYPRTFNPGFIEVEDLRLKAAAAHEMKAAFGNAGGAEDKTWLSIALSPPLPPGAEAVLTVRFRTKVPEKFGPFGFYDGLLTAAGAWYPCLPAHDPVLGWLADAPPAFTAIEAEIEVPADAEAIVNGFHFDARSKPVRYSSPCMNMLSLSVASGFHAYEIEAAGVRFIHYRLDADEGFAEKILGTAKLAIEFFRKRTKRPLPQRLALVEARIRGTLTDHGGGGSGFVSDRLLRVLPYPVDLRKYHLREVADEIFYMLFLDSVRTCEGALDYNWVAEGCAWLTLRKYLDERNIGFDEVVGLLKTFSFIPVIDQTLVAPRFPFNDVFFDTFFKSEPHRESVFRFSNRIPFGRIIIEKLKDSMHGREGEIACWRYASGPQGPALREAVEGAAGRSMGWFFDQWRKGYPRVNYSIADVRKEPLSGGRTRVTVEIKREGGGGFLEYVDVGVVLDGGAKYFGRVAVTGETTTDSFVYPDDSDTVIVDPFGRCLEETKTDNSSPRSLKILVTSFQPRLEISPDFRKLADTEIRLDIWGGFAAIAEGDYDNQIFVNYFYEQRGFGFNLGYMYSFGFKLDRTEYPQGLGAFVFFEKLDRSFAKMHGNGDSGHDQLVTGSVRLFYTFDTRTDQRNPHSGAAFTLTGEYADKILGFDFRFVTMGGNLRWLFSPSRNQVFAFQVRFSTSWGEMPRQRMFALGGYSGLRGIPENAVLGSHLLLLRAEYRHLLLNELDINFFWIGYIRRLAGSLFLEIGSVTDHRADLIELENYRASIGYGFKVAFDSFGVRPFIVGMDVAFRLDDVSLTPEIFFTIGQSF